MINLSRHKWLAARREEPFTRGVAAKILEHNGPKIDGRGYAGSLDAVAGDVKTW